MFCARHKEVSSAGLAAFWGPEAWVLQGVGCGFLDGRAPGARVYETDSLCFLAQPGMVDVVNRLCAAEGCSKHPNFNHLGQSMVRRHLRGWCRKQPCGAAIARITARGPCTASVLAAAVAHWLGRPFDDFV